MALGIPRNWSSIFGSSLKLDLLLFDALDDGIFLSDFCWFWKSNSSYEVKTDHYFGDDDVADETLTKRSYFFDEILLYEAEKSRD